MLFDNSKPNEIINRTLRDWHNEAYHHFSSLSKAKKEHGLPLFALEHPFSNASVKAIESLLMKDFAIQGINMQYWLLWVIYATEIGYGYIGDEYWDSFNEQLGDLSYNQRDQIKSCFTDFYRKFSGVVPVGTWASHFTIIAQPITHAILPKDLQFPFAKLLFESRHQLGNIPWNDFKEVGRLLACNSVSSNSSRFQNFLEQEELVGQIASALLSYNSPDQVDLVIHVRTLRRIVADLERKDSAKKWIRQTRNLRPRMIGASSKNRSAWLAVERSEIKRGAAWKVRPKLKLRLTEKGQWMIILDIAPWPKEALDRNLTEFLLQSRFQVPSAGNNWTPADNLRRVGVNRKLMRWPGTESLMRFNSRQITDGVPIDLDIAISPNPWVFKIVDKGSADEVLSKVVRPGKSYIFLFEADDNVDSSTLQEIQLTCSDVCAYFYTVPEIVSGEEEQLLKALGIAIQKTLIIKPIGKTARLWDGEGYCEWLTTDAPTFSLKHDYDLDDIEITLYDTILHLKPKVAGELSFIRLEPLPAGEHILKVKAISRSSEEKTGTIVLAVREPIMWSPGLAFYNGIHVFFDSIDDNLDSFLSGSTKLYVLGSKDLPIYISFTFYLGGRPIDEYISDRLLLPLTNERIKEVIKEIRQVKMSDICDEGILVVKNESMGFKRFRFTRNAKPFRWIYEVKDTKPSVRLLDHTATDGGAVSISYFDIQFPDRSETIDANHISLDYGAATMRGLFWAEKEGYSDGIIVSAPNKAATGLNSLLISPSLAVSESFDLLSHLSLIEKWYSSRSITFYTEAHVQRVVSVLMEKLYGMLCGSHWASSEYLIIESEDLNSALSLLLEQINNASIGHLVRFRIINVNVDEFSFEKEVKWLLGALTRCHLYFDETVVRSVIDFVTNPLSYIPRLQNGETVRFPNELLKIVRVFALGLSQRLDPFRDYPLLMPSMSLYVK